MELIPEPPLTELAKAAIMTYIPGADGSDIVRATIVHMGGADMVQGDPELAYMVLVCHMHNLHVDGVDGIATKCGMRERFKIAAGPDIRRRAGIMGVDLMEAVIHAFGEAYTFTPDGDMVQLVHARHFRRVDDEPEGDGWLTTSWR